MDQAYLCGLKKKGVIEILHHLITSFSKQLLFILKMFAQPFLAGPGELYDEPIYSRTHTFKGNDKKTSEMYDMSSWSPDLMINLVRCLFSDKNKVADVTN